MVTTRTAEEPPETSAATSSPANSTALRAGTIGVLGIIFFVLSMQAPMTGIVGASPLSVGLGNGPGAPGAYLVVGLVIILFAVGFVAMSRRISANGGFYAYVSAALGRKMGGGAAWLAILTYASVQAGMYGLYGISFSALLAQIGLNLPWWLLVLLTMALVHLLGTRNIELGSRFLAILVGFEMALLLAFGLKTLLSGGGPEGLAPAASFSPAAVTAGAPGVAIVFAIASMFGFESTAIYSGEAKDPKRTVARATYLSVIIIAVFFSFTTWMIVSFYGPTHVVDAAGAALQSGDSGSFVFNAFVSSLGPWAAITAQILLLTSLLAGVIALHNSVNRYLHSLALHRTLPIAVARTNKHQAPAIAALASTTLSILLVAPFVILNLDPVLTLFSWFSGLSVASLLVLYVITSVSVVVYFRRNRSQAGIWPGLIAPVLATVLLLWLLYLVIDNFNQLIGGDLGTAAALLAFVPVCFILGTALEAYQARRSPRFTPNRG